MLSSYIKLHDFRLIRLLCMDSGVQLILILLQKHCVALSDHIMVGICSDTLVTQGATSSLILTAALVSQGAFPAL